VSSNKSASLAWVDGSLFPASIDDTALVIIGIVTPRWFIAWAKLVLDFHH
jgi:hypothetical protein